ncbi:hypothetical protein PRIPAC_70948 [Pristionchus pacificus]|uniref:Uncharacterized protein n=1 Tax=Pristionchus pacificus TaxID=54126 RepID=A0A2A6C1Q3_PRIPA|nr:hypothetical protein PRIPAC_70948 [Pristionchus pacificus]|eukprot:PDM72038.1 hypothetical protein PRIPAC_38445 [Pristionchus pacificus]
MADDTTSDHSTQSTSQSLWSHLPPTIGSLSSHNDLTSPFSPQCFSNVSSFNNHPYTPQIALHPWAYQYQSLHNLYGPYPFGVPAAFQQPPFSSSASTEIAAPIKKDTSSILGPSSVLTAENLAFYSTQSPVKKRSCETNKRPGPPYKLGSKERTEEQKAMARQRARVYRAKKKRETLEKLTSVRMSNFGQSQYHHPQISSNSQRPYPPSGLCHHHALHHSSSAYFPPSSIPSYLPVHNPYPPEYQNPIYPYRSVPWPQLDMKASHQLPAYHPSPQRVQSCPSALHYTPTQHHSPSNPPNSNHPGAVPDFHRQRQTTFKESPLVSCSNAHLIHSTKIPNSIDHPTVAESSHSHCILERISSSSLISSTPAFHRVDSTSFLGPFAVPASESFIDPSIVPHAITTSRAEPKLGRRGPPARPGAKERTEEQKARARESSRAYRERKMLGITMNRKALEEKMGKRERFAKVAIKRDKEKEEEEEYRPSHKKAIDGRRRRSTRTVASGTRPEYRDTANSIHF